MDSILSQSKQQWLAKQCVVSDVFSLAGDASFRQYFRVISGEGSFILMDAQKEPAVYKAAFNASAYWFENDLPVPKVIAHDDELCCLLIDDFGDNLYSIVLNQHNYPALYQKAMDVLLKLYTAKPKAFGAYKALDDALIDFECQGFCQFYLEGLLGHVLDEAQKEILKQAFDFIRQQVSAQPYVFIHRDYHCRNILVCDTNPLTIGIIDFQDAMLGPITYDLASLLRDCYIQWPKEDVLSLVNYFYTKATDLGIINNVDEKMFIEWFNITSIERHLKAIFTFSRKALRDHDESFLKNIQPTLSYIFDNVAHYEELHAFGQLLQTLVKERE